MSLYYDFGYNFFKFGEEVVVDLNIFIIIGKKCVGMWVIFNCFEREGYIFFIYELFFFDELYEELRKVLDVWFGGKKEKGFLFGYFDCEYISCVFIVILFDVDGKIIVFIIFMFVY